MKHSMSISAGVWILLWVVSLITPAVVFAQAQQPASQKAAGLLEKSQAAPVILANAFIEAAINERGQFTLGTIGGSTATTDDDNQRLLFGHPNPRTSFTTLRVDGQDVRLDQSGTLVQAPANIGGGANVTVWQAGGLEVTQTLTLTNSTTSGNPDAVEIRYTVRNTTGQPHELGLRIMLDTELGQNDGASFEIPGVGAVRFERDFTGADVPPFYQALEHSTRPLVRAEGTLLGATPTPPDRFAIARWGTIFNTGYDYRVNPQARITDDSAVGIWWLPRTVAAGVSLSFVTFYGTGGLGTGGAVTAGLVAPTQLNRAFDNALNPNPFTVTLRIDNTTTQAATGLTATLALPAGLTLVGGGSDTQTLGTLGANQTGRLSWAVQADEQTEGALTLSVTLNRDGAASTTLTRMVNIPEAVDLVTGLSAPNALLPRRFRMLSVPLNLIGPELEAVMTTNFGSFDPERWQVMRWHGITQSYTALPDLNSGFYPGLAFWIVTRTGGAFNAGSGVEVSTAQPYPVLLEPGWNQIGNPFSFPVAWARVQAPATVEPPVFWNGAGYQDNQTTLQPWAGYFVYNDDFAPVTLLIPPEPATGASKTTPVTSEAVYTLQWMAALPGQRVQDTQNFIGFSNGAPMLRTKAPPPAGPHVRLSILGVDRHLYQSFVPQPQQGQVWNLALTATTDLDYLQVHYQVQLRYAETGRRPEGFGVYVWDLDHAQWLSLADGALTVFMNRPVRRLQVMVGTEVFALQQQGKPLPNTPDVTLHTNFPNPFQGQTTLRYHLRRQMPVRLEIYNALGQRVQTLVEQTQTAGSYSLAWDGRDANGRPVASGVYICRLEANTNLVQRTLLLQR